MIELAISIRQPSVESTAFGLLIHRIKRVLAVQQRGYLPPSYSVESKFVNAVVFLVALLRPFEVISAVPCGTGCSGTHNNLLEPEYISILEKIADSPTGANDEHVQMGLAGRRLRMVEVFGYSGFITCS
jgi:hypothetical protein